MPAKAKRILVSTETYDRVTYTFGGSRTMRGFCEFCGGETGMISVEAASAVTGDRSDAIFRLIENSGVHVVEPSAGVILVCERSLSREFDGDVTAPAHHGPAKPPVVA